MRANEILRNTVKEKLARNELAAEFAAMGAGMISTGTDIQFLLAAATEKAGQVHEISV